VTQIARKRRLGHVIKMDEAAKPNRLTFVELGRKWVTGDSLNFVAFDEISYRCAEVLKVLKTRCT
jgi:hypothetical protein